VPQKRVVITGITGFAGSHLAEYCLCAGLRVYGLTRQLKHFGFETITLAVGHLASQVEAYFGHGEKWGVKISYSYEATPLGTAGPIALVDDLSVP
jgi:hypothetical protein